MQHPLSVCSHLSVVSLNVPLTTPTDWLHVTSNNQSTLNNLNLHSTK